jgi:hypothetical protein
MVSIVTMIRSQVSAPSLSPRSRADHLARFCNRLVAVPIEMQVRGAQNIEFRDRHDQAITDSCW